LRAIGSPAIASTVVDSNRDRPPDPGRERALIHEFGKGHILERDAERLEQRQVGSR
jgi:hypothetical protein